MSSENVEKSYLKLSQKEVGHYVALILLGSFLIFLGGYFIGKKKMLEEISARHDAGFADKVSFSLANLYADRQAEAVEEDSEDEDVSAAEDPISEQPSKACPVPLHYAQLCGFGSQRAAEQYVEKLKKRNLVLPVKNVQRKSRNKKGKNIAWYQVVTDSGTYDDVTNLVKQLKKQDALTGVRVLEVSTLDSEGRQ